MLKALAFNVELPVPFEAAVSQVKDALKQEGFGVLTEIDLRAAFREKLGRRVPTLRHSRRLQPAAGVHRGHG